MEILSGQPPSGRPLLMSSDPLITLLQEDVTAYKYPPSVADALGYLQRHLQELTKCQNTLEHTINTTLTCYEHQVGLQLLSALV